MGASVKYFISKLDFSWRSLRDLLIVTIGAFLQALAMRLFLVPANLVSGGISGFAQILHYTLGWPIGLIVLLGNIPLFILGWRYLGGSAFCNTNHFEYLCLLNFYRPAYLPYRLCANNRRCSP